MSQSWYIGGVEAEPHIHRYRGPLGLSWLEKDLCKALELDLRSFHPTLCVVQVDSGDLRASHRAGIGDGERCAETIAW